MVANCVAYMCNSLQDKRNSISFHSFPFNRPEILNLWILAVRRQNWKPTKFSKLCSNHFVANDYLQTPGKKLLKLDAVPSKFTFPENLIKTPLTKRIIKKVIPNEVISTETTIQSVQINKLHNDKVVVNKKIKTVKVKRSIKPKIKMICQDQKIQTDPEKNENILKLRSEVKILKQKIKRRDLTIKRMEELLQHMKDKKHVDGNMEALLKEYT